MRALLAFLCCLGPAACDNDGGDDERELSCVEIDYTACSQLYPPTWDQVWQQTLEPSCGGGGSSCHPSGGPAGSLTFMDQATTYMELTSGAHVIAGDPACSPVIIRLESDDPGVRMPPGNTPIPAGARCSIATWIADGAVEN